MAYRYKYLGVGYELEIILTDTSQISVTENEEAFF
jgi:hypothetical protein